MNSFYLGGDISVSLYNGSGCTSCLNIMSPKKGILTHTKWYLSFLKLFKFSFCIFGVLCTALHQYLFCFCHILWWKCHLQYQKHLAIPKIKQLFFTDNNTSPAGVAPHSSLTYLYLKKICHANVVRYGDFSSHFR